MKRKPYRKKLKTGERSKRVHLGKKGFLMDWLTDFYSIIGLAFTIAVFVIIYKSGEAERERQLEDITDISYGNYMSSVYLRMPIVIDEQEMEMSELIAIYDHIAAGEEGIEISDVYMDTQTLIIGEPTESRRAIVDITNNYIEKNYDQDKCYIFSIHGNNFEYSRKSPACGFMITYSLYHLFGELDDIPSEIYETRIAPVDPREDTIIVYSIYDYDSLITAYVDQSIAGSLVEIAYDSMCESLTDNPICAILGEDRVDLNGDELIERISEEIGLSE